MLITAKFPSSCPICKCPIRAGAKVQWSKGAAAVHEHCAARDASKPAAKAATSPMPKAAQPRGRGGKPTGCSCGSRYDAAGDLIPSRHNCATCEHDA